MNDIMFCEPSAIRFNLAMINNNLLPIKSYDNFEEEKNNINSGDYQTLDGIAVIHVNGFMQKAVSQYDGYCSTIKTRASINQACNDETIKGIFLIFETPGGATAGTAELADCIANCSKPINGYISDSCHSAGYNAAAQCDYLSINKSGRCGSIGTYGVIYDTSKAYETQGVKAILITSGELKGQGADGVAISDKCIQEIQNQIDSLTAMFVQAVADGRELPLDSVKTLATGATWGSADALSLGLVDAVESMEVALDNFTNELNNKIETKINLCDIDNMEGTLKMSEEKVEEIKVEKVEIKSEEKETEIKSEAVVETVYEVKELVEVIASKVEEKTPEFLALEAKILALENENEKLKANQIAPASHEPIKMNLSSKVEVKKPMYVNGRLNK